MARAGDGARGRDAGAASIIAAAAAVGSSDDRFAAPQERRNRWGGCFGSFSCFGSQKRAKRIVPSRIPDGNVTSNGGNGTHPAGMSNQTSSVNLSLLAPPSSPASFTHSALPSTAQSPSFLSMSANSPGELSSTMYTIGPYAHETQLVSPPVFSTYTTEPSTAPLTPPPELAHLTTPSSPDVPFAHYLSSSLDFKNAGKENGIPYVKTGYVAGSDLRATYPLYPGSPASSLISPISGTPRTGLSSPFPEQEISTRWIGVASAPDSRTRSPKQFRPDNSNPKNFMLSPNSGFFYPAKSAQFYLDQAQQPNSSTGGRLSISREPDMHLNCGIQLKQNWKQDVEELEAYRASFGFSADEIITAPSYTENPDTVDISFAVPLTTNNKQFGDQNPDSSMADRVGKEMTWPILLDQKSGSKQDAYGMEWKSQDAIDSSAGYRHPLFSRPPAFSNFGQTAADEILSKRTRDARACRSFRRDLSSSDAEIDYRRSRSLKGASSLL